MGRLECRQNQVGLCQVTAKLSAELRCFFGGRVGFLRLLVTARDWQRSELTSSILSRFRHKYNKKHCRSTFGELAFLLMACYGVGSGTMVHIARLQVNRPSVVPLAVWAVNKTATPTTQT